MFFTNKLFCPRALPCLAGLCIAVAAIALRSITLPTPAVWFDEIHTHIVASYPMRPLIQMAAMDAHPPLYFILVRCARLAIEHCAPFARTINSLRIVSLAPGLLLCWLAWRFSRRGASAETALWTALLFAVSPPLAYYAVELRNYGPAQFTLFLATLLLIRFFEGPPRARAFNAAGYAMLAVASLYLQNLSILYLLAHGVLFLDEVRRSDERKAFLLWGGGVALAIGACYAPWIPRLLEQNKFQNTATFYTVSGADLPNTYLLYLPFGGLTLKLHPSRFWGKMLIGFSLSLFALIAFFHFRSKRAGRDGAMRGAGGDRVMRHCMVMLTGPIILAYLLSLYDLAKVFFPIRYNQLAAPYFLVVLVRSSAVMPPAIRRMSLGILAAVCLPLCLMSQWARIQYSRDATCLEGRPMQQAFQKPGNLFWTDARMNPWLDRIVEYHYGAPGDVTESDAPMTHTVWFITHGFTSSAGGRYHLQNTLALEHLLAKTDGVEALSMTGCLGGETMWRVPPEVIPVLREGWRELHAQWNSARSAVPGGQVLLPGDPDFADEIGWAAPSMLEDGRLWCWTLGPRQTIRWTGPEKPGRYRIELQFWRNHPLPKAQILLRCRWPGESGFQDYNLALGGTTLSREIILASPEEPLAMELRGPTWKPADHIKGSKDDRSLGVEFLSLSVIPLSPP